MAETYLAIDLGAESGRAIAGSFDGEHLRIHEVHRFANVPVRTPSALHWDLDALLAAVRHAIAMASRTDVLTSVGADAWGVDFGLLDERGELLGAPYHYRDARTEGVVEAALEIIPRAELYERTGVQLMRINTMFQLFAMVRAGDPALRRAQKLLTIPDLVHRSLSGASVCELTIASTTQCYDARAGAWATDLTERLGVPSRIFPETVAPGTLLGRLRSADGDETGTRVIAPGSHDTASAVAGTPLAAPDEAFISAGTWSLVGVERTEPLITPAALALNVTNELGVAGTVRLLRNVMGLWLLQGLRASAAHAGAELSYDELIARAEHAQPFAAVIDPDDPALLAPPDMAEAIRACCRARGETPPDDLPGLARVALEALALRTRWLVDRLEGLTGRAITRLRVVGGGSKNALLCQMTADATGRAVLAGPAEATALGNIAVQLIAARRVSDLAEARAVIARSFPPREHLPRPGGGWDDAYAAFSRGVS